MGGGGGGEEKCIRTMTGGCVTPVSRLHTVLLVYYNK
jgi:hypothetical protein